MTRILVIDDDELFVKLMVHALRERGHEVEFAHDGEAGEHAFDAKAFDAVVCDLMMPRQEGLETIRHMRRTVPNLAIVAISSGLERESGVDILDMAKRLGAHETVRKPFKLSQLTAAVDRAIIGASAPVPSSAITGA